MCQPVELESSAIVLRFEREKCVFNQTIASGSARSIGRVAAGGSGESPESALVGARSC